MLEPETAGSRDRGEKDRVDGQRGAADRRVCQGGGACVFWCTGLDCGRSGFIRKGKNIQIHLHTGSGNSRSVVGWKVFFRYGEPCGCVQKRYFSD